MSTRGLYLYLLLITTLISGCRSAGDERTVHSERLLSQDSAIQYNRALVDAEDQKIEDFLSRYRWQMEKSSTGLRYMIVDGGKGLKPVKGSVVTIACRVKLLNGEAVSENGADNPVRLTIGKRNVVNGLEEGILLLRSGGKAKFIVPAHLGYGFLGDPGKIPTNAVLVYEVELLSVAE